jgi:glycine cleavage system H lipoate-binding protein
MMAGGAGDGTKFGKRFVLLSGGKTEKFRIIKEVQVMSRQINVEKEPGKRPAARSRAQMAEVFGFRVPTETYYLHRGHAWAVVENENRVRVGLDDFSQKVLGRADKFTFPEVGKVYRQDHIFMALVRQKRLASFLAPVDGTIEAINPKVRQRPSLVHDDPYGEGWLFLVNPINLRSNLDNLAFGEGNAAWIELEAHRLLNLLGPSSTLPDGGSIIDDVYGHYPQLNWQVLQRELFLPLPTIGWKKKL